MSPTVLAPTPDVRPSARRRGRRALAWLALVVAVVGLSAACQVDNTPKAYEDSTSGTIVQTNFVATCTGTQPNGASTTTSLATKSFCECAFAAVKATVPFDDADRSNHPGYPSDSPTFRSLEADLTKDPGAISKLTPDTTKAIEACKSGVGPGTTLG